MFEQKVLRVLVEPARIISGPNIVLLTDGAHVSFGFTLLLRTFVAYRRVRRVALSFCLNMYIHTSKYHIMGEE